MAASNYFNDVQKLYLGYYGRAADAEGLSYWSSRVDKNGGNLAGIINEFANSAEAKKLYGGLNNSALIDKIYNQIFQRSPDGEGMKFYTEQLNNGTYTPGSLVFAIIQGSREQDLTGLNKALNSAMSALDAKAISSYLEKFGTDTNWVSTYSGINYGGLVLNANLLQREDFGLGKTLDSTESAALKQLTSHKAQEAAVAYLTKIMLHGSHSIIGEDITISNASMSSNSGIYQIKIGGYKTEMTTDEYGAFEILTETNQYIASLLPLVEQISAGIMPTESDARAAFDQVYTPIIQLAGQYHLDQAQLLLPTPTFTI